MKPKVGPYILLIIEFVITTRFNRSFFLTLAKRERINVDHAISMIGMPVRPTLDIIPSWHNTSGARLLTPLGVGTYVVHPTWWG